MQLANPSYLFLLLFVPIYLVGLYFAQKSSKGVNVSVFSDLKKASGKPKFYSPIYLRRLIVVLLIILWNIVLARPQGAHEKQEIGKNGIDIIIAMDVSESMLAEDLKPNRIEAAKNSLEKFIKGLENDRLGIIVFAGQAFTQSPLTFDYNILQEYINNISTGSVNKRVRGLSGTAIGDAILSSVNRFKQSEDRTKVLVVITDGDANTGVDPKIAAKKAKQENIKIYTVGVGKAGGAPMPTKDALGRTTYAKNRNGSLVMATFNESALKEIADIGGGKYFRAGDNKSFDKVMEEINALEKREIKTNITTEYTENFMPFLIGLFVLFGLYLLIGAYKVEVD